jgi:transketolase
MLRSIPGLVVIRPADANETAHAWAIALKQKCPTAILLTRQNLDPLSAEQAANIHLDKGAYVLSDETDFEYLIIASGSEVQLALKSAALLRKEGKKVRVVSMPSQELFLAQNKEYREKILPPNIHKRITIEAGTTYGWERFAGRTGLVIGLDRFGLSAPYKILTEEFGFTPEKIADKIKNFSWSS